jgi:hypothetical protein
MAAKMAGQARMQSVLFDSDGEVWDPQSGGLARSLGSSISGNLLAEYTVRNLGFALVRCTGNSAHVSVRPAAITPLALGALLYWLHDHARDRVLISTLDGEWSYELVPAERAVKRVVAAMASTERERARIT